jgi:hypothetical protein
MKQCTFSTPFTVPHVGPVHYGISVFVLHQGSYGWSLPHFLTVA